MYSPEEKLKKMMFFGKIEIRHSQYTDEFHIWLPVKLRPVYATEYIVDLNAVGNDIFGKTINEAIDKMFSLLTDNGFWVQSSGERFRFFNGAFMNVNEIPSNMETEIHEKLESNETEKNNIQPWYQRAIEGLNLPSKTSLVVELIKQRIDPKNSNKMDEIQKEIDLLRADEGDQRFEDLMNDYIIKTKGWTIEEDGFIKEFAYLKEKKKAPSPVFLKLVSILGGTSTIPDTVVKPTIKQERFRYTSENSDRNSNGNNTNQSNFNNPQSRIYQSQKQEEYDWEYYEEQNRINEMEHDDWLAKEEMAESSYEDDLRYLQRVEDGEE